MNDVLPKPFTKEGLLNMLEKHLGHLKKLPDGLDMVPPTASTMGPTSSVHSLKEESPPGHSPSTVSTANWHSPGGQFPGISPAGSAQQAYGISTVGGAAAGYGDSGLQYPSPTTPISARPGAAPGPHRRAVSDMTGGDDLGGADAKRPRIFATTNAAMNQMRR